MGVTISWLHWDFGVIAGVIVAVTAVVTVVVSLLDRRNPIRIERPTRLRSMVCPIEELNIEPVNPPETQRIVALYFRNKHNDPQAIRIDTDDSRLVWPRAALH